MFHDVLGQVVPNALAALQIRAMLQKKNHPHTQSWCCRESPTYIDFIKVNLLIWKGLRIHKGQASKQAGVSVYLSVCRRVLCVPGWFFFWSIAPLWRAAKAFGTTCRSTHHATKSCLHIIFSPLRVICNLPKHTWKLISCCCFCSCFFLNNLDLSCK